MSPATPPDGGDATPARGLLIVVTCPKCGHELPPIAQSSERFRALKKNRKLLADTGPIIPKTPAPEDPRTSPTEIIKITDLP